MTKIHDESEKSSEDATKEESKKKHIPEIVKIPLRIIGLLVCLYFFIVSLNLMSASFPLIIGRYASEAFRSNVVLTNPIASIMIGVLATVVVQSSSTSTSIVVSMVASGVMEVRYAIPIIMGTNIGTSITSTIVALSHATDKEKFRKSFAGATVHDMFNLLTVAILLPLELLSGFLERFSGVLVAPLSKTSNASGGKEPELLGAITKVLVDAIIQIDKRIMESIASNASFEADSLIKRVCKNGNSSGNGSTVETKCNFLFAQVDWADWVIGTILLVISLVLLSSCLVGMVKILSSIFKGPVAAIIQKVVNSDLPGVFKYFTGFIVISLGCILTILVQSSSVFTSTLTPLVGMGLVSLERVFPLTLGSNIGTTVTGILASLSGPSKTLKYSLQIALCHTLFNISGILIWYPIPCLRQVPINLARSLGNTTAKYRWFALVYILGMFFVIPIFVFLLSLMGRPVIFSVVGVLLVLFGIIRIVRFMQKKHPKRLPDFLKDWSFLPVPLRSLKPYDRIIVKYFMRCRCCKKITSPILEKSDKTNSVANFGNPVINEAYVNETDNFRF